MRCERKNGTFYGTAGQCRIGVQNEEREWHDRESKRWPQHADALAKLADKVAGLPEDQRAIINAAMSVQLSADGLRKNWEGESGEKVVGKGGRAYTEEESGKSMGSQIAGWSRLIEMGPPKTIVLRNGQETSVPAVTVPEVKQSSGQIGYREVANGKPGTKFSATGKPGVYAQNRATTADSDRVIHKIDSFRSEQTKKGKPWPAQELPPRTDIELNPDKIWASLTNTQIQRIGIVGLPLDGGIDKPGAQVLRFLRDPGNESLITDRARQIVERYAAQGGRSGVSGLPIGLPGLKADPSKKEEKSTVDHFNPISGSKGLTVAEIRKKFDHKGNFLLSEEGPNQARQENDWGGWVDKKLATEAKAAAKSAKASGSAAKPLAAPAPPPAKPKSSPSPIVERPVQSARAKLTNDQKSQLSNAMGRMGRLQESGLSESEAFAKLTPAQRSLYNQFMG